MNTITLANITIAALELFEDGLRKVIYCSDRLQEKLELHKLAVINNEQRKAEDKLAKLEQALVDIERNRQREVARINGLAKAQRADGNAAYHEGVTKLEQQDAILFEAHDQYVAKASDRGWQV